MELLWVRKKRKKKAENDAGCLGNFFLFVK